MKPFAIHITWTCYANWLPGDERGHVSNVLLASGGSLPKENAPGTPYRGGDAFTYRMARRLQKAPTARLDAELARWAAEALVDAARKRGWRILRAALMANHVHAVIGECLDDGPLVRRVLKGASQAALCEKSGFCTRWWTAGGSDRYKKDWSAIEAAIQYVAEQEWKLVEIIDMVVRDVPPG